MKKLLSVDMVYPVQTLAKQSPRYQMMDIADVKNFQKTQFPDIMGMSAFVDYDDKHIAK